MIFNSKIIYVLFSFFTIIDLVTSVIDYGKQILIFKEVFITIKFWIYSNQHTLFFIQYLYLYLLRNSHFIKKVEYFHLENIIGYY